MATTFVERKRVALIKRAPSAGGMGNPRYSVIFTDGSTFLTAVNTSVAYAISESMVGRDYIVTLERARKYAYIIDMREAIKL